MTDRNRKRTEFAADREGDRLLARLPREMPYKPNAFVILDASGAMKIYLDGGGVLSIREKDLAYFHGDELA